MKKKIVAAVAVLAMSLSACGTGADTKQQTGNDGYLDGTYTVGKVNVNGEDLTCVTMKRGASDSAWGGFWCYPPSTAPSPTPEPDTTTDDFG